MRRRQSTVTYITQLLVISTAFLVIPVCILLGGRRSGGALIVTGGVALAASIILWIVLGGFTSFNSELTVPGIMAPLLSGVTSILLVAGCALAIHAAAISRKWLWVFILVVAGYMSFVAIYLDQSTSLICYSGPTGVPTPISGILCGEPSSLRPLLFDLAHILGPLVVLIYGLVAVRTSTDAAVPATTTTGRRHGPPPGLYISPISSAAAEADTEPNMR
jgi:hypothetical protein